MFHLVNEYKRETSREIRGGCIKTVLLIYPFYKDDVRKVANGIKAKGIQIDVYDISIEMPDLTGYDRIGIVSGIYAFQAGKPLMKYLEQKLPQGKDVFIIYTYGAYRTGYAGAVHDLITSKECIFLGEYGCIGFDTFGPFKVSGTSLANDSLEYELKECAKFVIQLLDV